jgi:hypothetical protein
MALQTFERAVRSCGRCAPVGSIAFLLVASPTGVAAMPVKDEDNGLEGERKIFPLRLFFSPRSH